CVLAVWVEPWASVIARVGTASALISSKIVVPKERSRETSGSVTCSMYGAKVDPLSSLSRIRELAALRGFAVGGIMVVNTWQHAQKGLPVPLDWPIDALLQGRFYPIFSLLFGISFVLFMAPAGRCMLLSRLFWL